MARQKNKGEPSAETPAADAPQAPPVEGGESPAPPVEGTIETTEAPPVEGEKDGDFLSPQGDETELDPKGDETPDDPKGDETPDDPKPLDASDTPEEPARHLFHDEEVLVDRALGLAKRLAKLQGLDEPSAEDLANVRKKIAVDVLRDRALVETWCAKTEAELPKPAIIGFRVWAHGEFHIDGKVHRPGDIIKLPESYAEQFGAVLEPVTE